MTDKNPTCPNCGRTMTLAAKPPDPAEQHAFECVSCKLVFMTPDHQPVYPAK